MSFKAFTTVHTDHRTFVSLGLSAWAVTEDGRVISLSMTADNRPYPEETHTPEEFLREFKPAPYTAVWREAVNLGLEDFLPPDDCDHDFFVVSEDTCRCSKCGIREVQGPTVVYRLPPK